MNDQSKSAEPKDPRVEAALRDYLEGVDRGEAADREEFLSRHAEIADQLRSFIAAEDEVRKLAGAQTPLDRARDSTKSFVGHGQETLVPQSVGKRATETGVTGLAGQFGRYRIIRALGKGAMGMVYLAEDTQLQRQVALKTPHFEQEPTPELLERFYREARAAATLRHPNICPVHDVGQIEGTHYISMAYIDGHPLSAFIRSAKQQPERQILIIVRKLAQALQEAHDHGIVHRDLKPANIMVDKRNEPIIMDFGLARQLRGEKNIRITQSGMLIGTPAYMSPEQIDGEPDKVGPPSDQYSLGVILYELLTGQLPFRGSLTAVMAQIITKETTPPSQLRPDLDTRIEAACLKMMAKGPANRFASLSAAAEEFAIILRNPGAKQTSKDPGGQVARATPPPESNVADSGIRQSQAKKSIAGARQSISLAAKDLVSIEELARKCLARHDYDQVIQIIERIPEEKRNAGLVALLEKSRTKADEIAFLICEIDEALRFNDRGTALKKADELLKIKPGHHRALKVQEEFAGYGEGGAARIGLLQQFTQPWNEGGWIPWSVLAFGLAVFGVMTAVIVIQIGKTAVLIDVRDPAIEVHITAAGNKIEIIPGPKEERVEVEPGEQELKVSYAGLETRTKRFEMKKGQKRTVVVSLRDKDLVVTLDQETLPLFPDSETVGQKRPAGQGAGDGGAKVNDQLHGKGTKPAKPEQPEATKNAAATVRPPILVAPFDGKQADQGRQNWGRYRQIPTEIRDSSGMDLVLIPPGQFEMGTRETAEQIMAAFPGTRKEWIAKERPAHRVEISHPFYLSKYETTLGQFKTFVAETGYKTDAEKDWKGGQGVSEKGELTRNVKFNWRDWGTVQTDNSPAVNVSDADAIQFCKWLSGKEGKTYRLPTEAEWEYTCRAGTITQFYNGDDPKQLQKIANFGDSPKNNRMYTLPVGRLAPNNFGLYDMSGNVEEWCADSAAPDNYYDRSPEIDPEGPEHGMYRIARGGDWGSGALWCRSALRRHHDQRRGAAFIGFRVACAAASGPGTVDSGKQASGTPAEAPSSTIAIKEGGSSKPNIATTAPKSFGRPFLVRGEWTIENDELVQPTLAAGDDSCPLLVFGEPTLSNYDLTLEAEKTGGAFALGIHFHWQGPGHHREFRLVADGKMDFSFVYNGKWGREPGNSKGLNFSSNRWYSLKVEVRGDTFRAYLDGVLLFEQTDARFKHGRICLFTWNAAARFRRIKVSDPQGKVLFEGLPELPPASNNTTQKANIGTGSRLLTAGETAAKSAQEKYAKRLNTPVISTNSLGMKLALIPPGEFQMGSPNSERQRGGNEQQHRVHMTKPFYLGIYEITQSEFEQVMGRNPSEFSNGGRQAEAASGVDTGRYPVENVTWYDGVEFCNKLSEKEGLQPYYRFAGIEREAEGWIKNAKVSVAGGRGYRLPTEAQWEYACRAGTTTPFNFGIANNGAEGNCNGKLPYGTEEQGPELSRTVPVGSYRPNAFGLYDMHGNVWEWCWDVYDEAYYKHSPASDPAGPTRTPKVIRKKSKTKNAPESDPAGPSGGSHQARRGGGWTTRAVSCRTAHRGSALPEFRHRTLGFRLARSSGE